VNPQVATRPPPGLFNMAKTPKAKQKEKTWKVFSRYIRLRDADENGFITCPTCGVRKKWNDGMQAGHCIQGRHNSILYDERGVYGQCMHCNYFMGGEYSKFIMFVIKKRGKKVVEDLLRLDKIPKTYSIEELKQIEEYYKKKTIPFEHKAL